jgi:hypothetical protein
MRRQHDVTSKVPQRSSNNFPQICPRAPTTNVRSPSATQEATRIMLYKSMHDLQVLTPYTSIEPEILFHLELLQL